MPKLTAFDRTNARALSTDVIAALSAVAAEYGVTFAYAGGRFSPAEFSIKISAKVGDASAVVAQRADQAKQVFDLYSTAFGLKPEHFGHEFTYQGGRYRISGIKPKSPKFPILATKVGTGKTYKFPLEATGLVTAQQAGEIADAAAELAFERRANRF